jgi:hypothetical protein
MKTQHECGSLIFSHTVGSALIDNRSEDSDVDILSVYTHSMSVNMLIPIDIDVTSVHSTEYKTPVIDGLSVTGISVVYDLINDTEIPMSTLSKIISHLYAVKYNLMLSVDDKEVFNFYNDWLRSPGFAPHFWNRAKTVLWQALSSLPDVSCNWSQKFDGSDSHIASRDTWTKTRNSKYPVVDPILGYDSWLALKTFQTIFVARAVLLPNCLVSDDEKQFLKRLKYGKVSFEEYTQSKKTVWRKFRIAGEGPHSFYFLGEGYNLEDSKNRNIYGISGLNKLTQMLMSTDTHS